MIQGQQLKRQVRCLVIVPAAKASGTGADNSVGKNAKAGAASRKRRKQQRSMYRKTVSAVVDPVIRKERRRWHSSATAVGQPPWHEPRIEELARRLAEGEALGIPLSDGGALPGDEMRTE